MALQPCEHDADAVWVEILRIRGMRDDVRGRELLRSEDVVPVGVGENDCLQLCVAALLDESRGLLLEDSRVDETRLAVRDERARVVVQKPALADDEGQGFTAASQPSYSP